MSHVLTLARLPMPRKVRWGVLRLAGVRTQAWNIARCSFTGPRVTIGRSTFINRSCFFDASAPITIGARCAFGMEVMVITSTHELAGPDRRAGELRQAPVTIGDGCWIGARVTILPGVTIGDGSVIAAGAVVAEDVEPHAVYGGVPARRIRGLTASE